jgi:hypothetical protein
VPDENGELHNILDEPRWLDSFQIPRAGGRVVFRSRFADYTGHWTHHCHILAHEDLGMMQLIETASDPAQASYSARSRVASPSASGPATDAIYPRPSLELSYRQNVSFVDQTPTGQAFSGFPIEVPVLEG